MTTPNPSKKVTCFTLVYTPAVRNVLRQLCELGLSDLPLSLISSFLSHKKIVGVVKIKNELYGLDHAGTSVALIRLEEV